MNDFTIVRSQHIAAPPARVHALVNDFHEWLAWSPWEDLDPTMAHTYTGPDAGVGAKQAWVGNSKAGEGSMEIVASSPTQIDVSLAFMKPFKATNNVRLDFVAANGGTDVTWTMSGQQGTIGRIFYKLLNMEKALGADFEKGLTCLKALAESA